MAKLVINGRPFSEFSVEERKNFFVEQAGLFDEERIPVEIGDLTDEEMDIVRKMQGKIDQEIEPILEKVEGFNASAILEEQFQNERHYRDYPWLLAHAEG